jgi:esterase/lipase
MLRHKIILSVFLALILLGIVSYFANPSRHYLRLQSTGLNSHFATDQSTSFENYVAKTTTMIKLAREKGGVNATDSVVAENAPVVLLPDAANCPVIHTGKYSQGILLIHGLLDSSYAMHELGKFFQKKCFIVYVVLLPGHGTVPGDLLHTTYQDWEDITAYGVTKLAEKADHLYLGGFSTGGILAIDAALDKPEAFQGIILFAPVLKIKTRLTPLIPGAYWLSQIFESLHWWSVYADTATTRYESLPLNSVYQTAKLVDKVQAKLQKKRLSLPLFIEQSRDDVTVDASATFDFFQTNTNPNSQLLWFYENGDYPLLSDPRIQQINSTISMQKILSLSHLALTLGENDPIYGLSGEYKDCLSYAEDSSQWLQCKSGMNTYLGEVTDKNLHGHIMQRITFNPFHSYFLERLGIFIDATKKT